MKKIVPLLVVLVVGVAFWFAIYSRTPNSSSDKPNINSKTASKEGSTANTNNPLTHQPQSSTIKEDQEEEDEGLTDEDERPATEIYNNAEDALKAIKEAAGDYDDLVLDQFTELGENCSWCDTFYKSVKELMSSPDIKADQRSYYAEVLAVSGRLDNIQTLVDSIKNAKNEDDRDLSAEALELSVGNPDITRFLGEQLHENNEVLKEASVAAITNQGSRLAIEILHSHTLEKGDPDGYYSLGIGLGEVIPDEEAWPYLQELVMKKDAYSHLAVKSLLNSGLDGAKIVVDILQSSKNSELDKEMLRGAKDHVSYDDEVVAYFKQLSESSTSPIIQEFTKEVLADFVETDAEGDQITEEE